MRLTLVLCLFVAPLLAEEATIASRFPAGATAYVEARELAGKIDAALQSPVGEAIRNHATFKELMQTPKGRQFLFVQATLEGATGLDFLGVARALTAREAAVAAYGEKRVVAMARVDPTVAEALLTGAEILSQQQRVEILPREERWPALWELGPSFVCLDGDLLVFSTDRVLATSVRNRSAKGLAGHEPLREARRLVGATDLFVYLDLEAHGQKMKQQGKPADLGQALLLGAFAHRVPAAPWAAFGLGLEVQGKSLRLIARSHVPVTEAPAEAVRASFGGTLEPLPFALPERTLALSRMRRSLPAIWSHRDALIAERGIPGLVEFETNFGNLTGGMSWVEQFLPSLRDADLVLLATRRVYAEGVRAPAVRYPQGAVLFPIRKSERLGLNLQIGFQTAIGIINAQQGQMGGKAFFLSTESYRGTVIQTARYLPPTEGEQEMTGALPPRFNLEPSAAIVGDYFILASTRGIVEELIDAQGGRTPVKPNLNAGLWFHPSEILAILKENREALVARTMMKEGDDRPTAEKKIDFILDVGRYVRSLALTAEESRVSLGAVFELVLGPATE
ncbi:MAG: hypothetical protein ACYTEZ_01720 [Planctomycetota bacterium]|jgi:hypothetical protein